MVTMQENGNHISMSIQKNVPLVGGPTYSFLYIKICSDRLSPQNL